MIVQLGQALDPPDWDPLWFVIGHPMREELDRVMEEFVIDSSVLDGRLIERSYPDFQNMIERFGNEYGERFWGRDNREHLGSGAPVWTEHAPRITMALRWVFREVEDRLRQKLIAEAKQHEKAGDRTGYEQASPGVEDDRLRLRYTDDFADSAQFESGSESNEVVRHARQGSNLPDAPANVVHPTVTPVEQRVPSLKRERNMSFGDRGDLDNGNALLIAKFREITPGGLRKPKRDAGRTLQDSTVYSWDKDKDVQVVFKKPRRPTTQNDSRDVKDVVMRTNAKRLPLPSDFQQQNTTVHFFLTDYSLGAMPTSLQKCMTPGNFFKEALTAWHGLEPESSIPALVSVRFDWAPIPMVIKWKEKTGYKMMLEAIAAAPCWSQLGHRCNVEVRCVKRQL